MWVQTGRVPGQCYQGRYASWHLVDNITSGMEILLILLVYREELVEVKLTINEIEQASQEG